MIDKTVLNEVTFSLDTYQKIWVIINYSIASQFAYKLKAGWVFLVYGMHTKSY